MPNKCEKSGECGKEDAEKFLNNLILHGITEVLGDTPLVEASYLDEIVIVKRWCENLCPLLYAEALPVMYDRAGLNKVGMHDVVKVGDIMFEANALECLRYGCMMVEEAKKQIPLPFTVNPTTH